MARTVTRRYSVTNAKVTRNPKASKPTDTFLTIRGEFIRTDKDGTATLQTQPSVSFKLRDLPNLTFDVSKLDSNKVVTFTRTSTVGGKKVKESDKGADISAFLKGLLTPAPTEQTPNS